MTDSRLTGDVATMEAMAEMYREELDAAFTIVSDVVATGSRAQDCRLTRRATVSKRSSKRRPRVASQREILALAGSSSSS